ncbi:MAG: NAD(P) transhydrogenase subunit alpha [Pseudomonadota bacterium]
METTQLTAIFQENIGDVALHLSPFMIGLTVFVLAIFIGYYVVWHVTPALHSPLMAVTNAISSVIVVGALIAAGLPEMSWAKMLGFFAVILAAVNIFGGFLVTERMLRMFQRKKDK